MSKPLKRLLAFFGGLLAVAALLVVIVVGTGISLNNPDVQNRLLQHCTKLLSEKFQTRVTIDSISVNALKGTVNLYRVDIEDRQQKKMLLIEELSLKTDVKQLMKMDATRHIDVSKGLLKGCHAMLYGDTINGNNFQFVLDVFAQDQLNKKKKVKKDPITFGFDEVRLEDISLTYNGSKISFDRFYCGYSDKDKGQELRFADVTLDGLQVKAGTTQQLQLESFSANADIMPLLRKDVARKVLVNRVSLKGLHGQGTREALDISDYRPLIQLLEKAGREHKERRQRRGEADMPKKKISFDLRHVVLEDILMTYEDAKFALQKVDFQKDSEGKCKAEAAQLEASWEAKTKRGKVSTMTRFSRLQFRDMDNYREMLVDSLCYITANHRPRRNAGKPKFGFWDEGHLNLVAMMKLHINHAMRDSINADITSCTVSDRKSGVDVRNLKMNMVGNMQRMMLNDVLVQLPQTDVKIASAAISLPNKKKGRKFGFSTSAINIKVVLQDISRAFTPALANFTMPLYVSTRMDGDAAGMNFHNVSIRTADKQLTINAEGKLRGLDKDKYGLDIRFHVNPMRLNAVLAQKIINFFPLKKKFMMKELNTLGHMKYVGDFAILYKQEKFKGLLSTEVGDLNFTFGLDDREKYLSGTFNTKNAELGKVFDMPDLGNASCKADFKFDTSSQRTAKVRRERGGNLPVGEVSAFLSEANYKKIKVVHVTARVVSDGAVATGYVEQKNKRSDLSCDFSFTSTDELKRLKAKPRVKLHKDYEKAAAKAERKERKAAEKAERKEQKAAEKAQKAQEKAERKAQKAIEKEQKRQEKAERKAQKAAAKAERKAQKAAAKAQ